MYMYGWVPLRFTWNYQTLLTGYTPIQNKKLKKKWNSDVYYNMGQHADIMLYEINQAQKENYCMIPLILNT